MSDYKPSTFEEFCVLKSIEEKESSMVLEQMEKSHSVNDVCKWILEDEEANLYVTECQKRHLIFEGTPVDNEYRFCPYCGKEITVM